MAMEASKFLSAVSRASDLSRCTGRPVFRHTDGFTSRSSDVCNTICCRSFRRHQKRRDTGFRSSQKGPLFRENMASDDTRGAALDENIVITLDFQDIKHRAQTLTESAKQAIAASAARAERLGKAILDDSRLFLSDLRSSVSIQRDHRVVISLRRSSIDFALMALLCSALLIVAWRFLVKASKKYGWGWEESFDGRHVFKRDRSLGGREVFVGSSVGKGQNSARKVKQETWNSRRKINPLDAVEVSRSEREILKQTESRSMRKLHNQLPRWWPLSTSTSSSKHAPDEAAQEKASFLLKVILEKRTIGRDFEEDDILQLRRLCKFSGARVAFDSSYVRDSLYRAAISMVFSSCVRDTKQGGDEEAAEFLAGLADNIGLDPERATVLVNAAVAARTRYSFLQTWALHVQGRSLEAEQEVSHLSRILTALPPNDDSPEMEMVAQGLGQHLSYDERKSLLEIYVKAGGSSTEKTASEALGIHSARNRV